jgi:methylated-DNA-[protein]-cysteine S-methyltransferase
MTAQGWLSIETEGGVITRAYFSEAPISEGDPDSTLINALQQLQEYLNGDRKVFDLPLQPAGTPFQQKVWKALTEVKFGTTYSYKEFATKISDAKSARAVATAIGSNPLAILIPCHRIIGSKGDLTGYAWGLHRKEWLLNLEQGAYMPSLFETENNSANG